MAKNPKQAKLPEIEAMSAVYAALKDLDQKVQLRVLRYTAEVLGLTLSAVSGGIEANSLSSDDDQAKGDHVVGPAPTLPTIAVSEDIEGINAIALKWMKRSGLEPKSLQKLFSLGIEEIDLVAKSIPGSSKREKMRNVFLLKGIAAYLGTGVARMTHEQLKEACIHYGAYDGTNFARYIKEFAAEVSGTKEGGFTLTARGITAATDLIKEMLASK